MRFTSTINTSIMLKTYFLLLRSGSCLKFIGNQSLFTPTSNLLVLLNSLYCLRGFFRPVVVFILPVLNNNLEGTLAQAEIADPVLFASIPHPTVDATRGENRGIYHSD